MVSAPDERQPETPGCAGAGRPQADPRRPARHQPSPGSAAGAQPGTSLPDWLGWDIRPGEDLTATQIAELTRADEGPGGPDSACAPQDYWLALQPDEQASMAAEVGPRATEVAEAIDAGFTHHLGGNGTGFAAGGPLDTMLPGSDLAWHAGQARQGGLRVLSDDELIGFLGGVQRLESWAAGLKLEAVIELDARRALADGREGEHVAAEAGAALTLTPRSAQSLLERARDLDRLRPVLTLLLAGVIDVRKAEVVLRRLATLSAEHAAKVLDVVLPKAAQKTTGELGEACERAIVAVDPAAAERRKERAQRDARVEAWTEHSGTGALAGRDLPPADVIAADKSLSADARWLRRHGVAGPMDLLRAKAFIAHLIGQPLDSLLPAAAADGAGNGAASMGKTGVGGAAGTSGAGGASARGIGSGGTGSGGTGTGGTGTGGTGTVREDRPGGLAAMVNLTIPWRTWLGLSGNPGVVAGYGTADGGTCRDLAGRAAATTGSKWCVTVVDDRGRAVGHGCARHGPGPPGTSDPQTWLATIKITAIAVGTCSHRRESTGYRPPDSLRHLIKIRSPRCGEPGCRAPAGRSDDDHTIPWHMGGRTCECNLHPMCRRSHRTKQAPGWRVTQPEPGVLVWTLPSGRTYTKVSEPYPV
jgi:hypothetical protein